MSKSFLAGGGAQKQALVCRPQFIIIKHFRFHYFICSTIDRCYPFHLTVEETEGQRGIQGKGPQEGGALREEKGKERGAGGNSDAKSYLLQSDRLGELMSLPSCLLEGGQGDE